MQTRRGGTDRKKKKPRDHLYKKLWGGLNHCTQGTILRSKRGGHRVKNYQIVRGGRPGGRKLKILNVTKGISPKRFGGERVNSPGNETEKEK